MSFEHININLADAADPFAAIEEGEYELEVVDLLYDPSKAGDAMLTFVTQVIGHPDHTGHQIRDWCVLEGKGQKGGLWKLRQWAEACDIELRPVNEMDFEQFRGQTVMALVDKRPPQGEYGESNSIKSFL